MPTPSHGNWPQINFSLKKKKTKPKTTTSKFKYHENKTKSPAEDYPAWDSQAESRGHPEELVHPGPQGQPLPIEFLAEECGQFLQVRETGGARLGKIRVQGELGAYIILDGFQVLFWKPEKNTMTGLFYAFSHRQEEEEIRILRVS